VRGQMTDDRGRITAGRRHRAAIFLVNCVFWLPVFLGGCSGPDPCLKLFDERNKLAAANTELTEQIRLVEAENVKLKKEKKVCCGLPENLKGENIYQLEQVKITRLTNLYDKDDDGKKEKLIVYIQTIDADGDIIKATGDVDVELWNLENKDGEAMLGRWQVKQAELKKLWFAAMMATNYRLTFDISDKLKDPTDPLTVKVAFTDYLTGKVFKEKTDIKPR